MTIECLPKNETDIKSGFNCTGEIEGGSVGETGIKIGRASCRERV